MLPTEILPNHFGPPLWNVFAFGFQRELRVPSGRMEFRSVDRDRAGKSLKVAFTDGKTQKLNSMHAPLGRGFSRFSAFGRVCGSVL